MMDIIKKNTSHIIVKNIIFNNYYLIYYLFNLKIINLLDNTDAAFLLILKKSKHV
jgi:hypothetical protein